jgi:hypothetical protein
MSLGGKLKSRKKMHAFRFTMGESRAMRLEAKRAGVKLAVWARARLLDGVSIPNEASLDPHQLAMPFVDGKRPPERGKRART